MASGQVSRTRVVVCRISRAKSLATTSTKEMFIVTSRVCAATLAMAYRFPDAGHQVVSFNQGTLHRVNLDASRTGGIQEIWTSGALR